MTEAREIPTRGRIRGSSRRELPPGNGGATARSRQTGALGLAVTIVVAIAVATHPAPARPDHGRPTAASSNHRNPSPVVYPPQRIPIRMTHAQHLQRLGLGCVDCHERAPRSHAGSDDLLPDGTRCDRCHHTDHRDLDAVRATLDSPLARCDSCHLGYQGGQVVRVELPTPNLHFDHAKHVVRNIGCAQCHGRVDRIDRATEEQLPRMRSCMRCHQQPGPARGDARGECTTCHLAKAGVLDTRLGAGRLLPPAWMGGADHGPGWIERHREIAGANSRFCANCHVEQECVACHDGRVRPRSIHPNDWLTQHGVAASMASQRCSSCHRQQSFCATCHERLGISQSGPLEPLAGRGRFHPPPAVWSGSQRGPKHHAWQAQRNLAACVSCHVERDCAMCHATAARGGRGAGPGGGFGQGTGPHPPGFTARCRIALRKNARACLVCHDAGDRALQRCE